MTIEDIKKQEQDKLSVLFKECKLFWAFSNEQFAENKTELKEGEKYVSIGAGGYLPKGNLDQLLKGMKDIKKWFKSTVKKLKQGEAYIIYELANHECFYTGDIEDAINVLSDLYTREEVQRVYNKHHAEQIELRG